MMTLDDYMTMGYKIEMTKELAGTWHVKVPELKGCETAGNSFGEALDNIVPVIGRCIEDRNKLRAKALGTEQRTSASEV